MGASLVLLAVGGSVGSPEGGLVAAVLSFFCAVAPAVTGTKWVRIVGILLLLASIAMATTLLPAARGRNEGYRDRAHRASR